MYNSCMSPSAVQANLKLVCAALLKFYSFLVKLLPCNVCRGKMTENGEVYTAGVNSMVNTV